MGRSLDCLAPVDGARLGFQNDLDGSMENQLVASGQRVELRCRVVGAPQATIRWKVCSKSKQYFSVNKTKHPKHKNREGYHSLVERLRKMLFS